MASGYKISKELADRIITQTKVLPSIDNKVMFTQSTKAPADGAVVDEVVTLDWRTPFIKYFNNLISSDKNFKRKAFKYMMIGEELYRKTLDGLLLKCLGR